MRYLLLLSMLCLTACGDAGLPKRDPRTVIGVSPEFHEYVDEYVSAKGSPLNYEIPIGFVDQLPGNTVGMCTRWSDGKRQIQIKRSYWNNLAYQPQMRATLLLHELGHCDLNLDHSLNKLAIMYDTHYYIPEIDPNSFSYQPYMFSNMLNELFNRTTSTLASKAHVHDETCVKDISVE